MMCPDENELLAFTQRLLPAGEWQELERHIDGCHACRRLVAETLQHLPPAVAVTRTADGPPGPTSEVLPSGAALGSYVLQEPIGRGGMGIVYRGEDLALKREVAVKVLRPRPGVEPELLLAEAETIARLSHPNVVAVFGAGVTRGQAYFAMEYVRGETLLRWLSRQGRGWREVLRVLVEAGRGLAAAHAAGLVHGDFKPENVLVGDDGRVRVSDFGLSLHEVAGSPGHAPLRGTPAYLAPELWQGQRASARSDQFAFGVTLFEAVYGQRPFPARTREDLRAQVSQGLLALPPRPRLPPALKAALRRALRSEPAQRFPAMNALLSALERSARPRGPRWLAAGVGVAGLAGALGLAHHVRSQAGACRAAERRLTEAWSETRQRAVRQALMGSAEPYAPKAWAEVRRTLDDYVAAWRERHHQACVALESGQVPLERPYRQLACLDRRLQEATALTTVLARPDPALTPRAVAAVHALGSPAACELAETWEEVPARPELGPGPQAGSLQEQVGQARVLLEAGLAREALELATRALARASHDGAGRLEAEASEVLGRAQQRLGHYAEAEQALRRAHVLARSLGHPELAARTAMALGGLVGVQRARAEDGLGWIEQGLSLLPAGKGAPATRAGLLHNRGLIELELGRYPAAIQFLEDALHLKERHLGPSSPSTASTLGMLAKGYAQWGRLPEAIVLARRALRLSEALLGDTHPDTVRAASNLAASLLDAGQLDEALQLVQRSLATRERTLGPDHPDTAFSLTNLGLLQTYRGDLTQALATLQRALAVREKAHGRRHPDTAASLEHIGAVWMRLGRRDEATRLLEESVEIRRQVLGPRTSECRTALTFLARLARDRRQYARALALDDEALAISREAYGPTHPDGAMPLLGLGETQLRLGHPRQALALLEQAFTLQEGHPQFENLADLRFALARTWLALGATGKAETFARDARDRYLAAKVDAADPRVTPILAFLRRLKPPASAVKER